MKRQLITSEQTKRGKLYHLRCNHCQKTFSVIGSRFNQGVGQFCSYRCLSLSISKFNLRGDQAIGWKGYRINHNQYILVYQPRHPRANRQGRIQEHIYNVEQHLKRYLQNNEVVHHKDGNRLNNKINNLQVMTKSQHMSLHKKGTQQPRDHKKRFIKIIK